jgi:hypothetical protein
MGSSSTKTESAQSTPWAPQADALTNAFTNAQNAYGTASQAQAPDNFVAQYTPDQLATFRSMLGYANNNTLPGTTANTATTMQNAGSNATAGALAGLGNYDPTQLNNTNSIINSANQYASGQDIDAQVRNAMLNATQTARDVTMPQIEQNAAQTGNTNSSRTGIADGLVQRGLAQQATDLGTTARNDAYKTGLQLASANAQANNTSALGALTNQGYLGSTATNVGSNAGATSVAEQGKLFDMANAGGAGEQASQQAALDNLIKQYQSGVTTPYAALNGPLTPAEQYLVHQQGVGGATAHLSNPDQPAWQSMLSTGEGRQKGEGWARKAIWGNVPDQYKAQFGSVDNITSGQFADMWRDRFGRASGGGEPSTPTAAINSAAGIKAPSGQPALASAFASEDGDKTGGALSANNTLGQGALNAPPDKLSVLGQMLTGMGASIAGISNPEQGKALTQQLSLMQKQQQGDWSYQVAPNGQVLATSSKGGLKALGKPGDYSKDDTYIPVHSVDPNTGLPTLRVFNKNTGEFAGGQGAGDPNAAPAMPSTIEELQQQNPTLAAQVIGVKDGLIPYPNASRLNPQQQMLKNAVSHYFPGVDATIFKGRETFMKNLATAQPSQPGGQFVGLGHSLDMARQLSEKALGLDNSDIGFGIGHTLNPTKDSFLGERRMSNDRSARVVALDENVDRMASEIGRLFSGNQGGGVAEREQTRSRFSGSNTPTEFAEGLKSVRDMILSRKDELLSQADALNIPHSRIPGLEKLDKTIEQLNGNIDKLRGNRKDTTAAPASGGTSWSDAQKAGWK